MREAATAIVAVLSLFFLPVLVLMNAIPRLKKFPQWIMDTFFGYEEINIPLTICFFIFFGFIISMIIHPSQFNPPTGPDYDTRIEDCDGFHRC
jgi:hypothetical protein